MQLNDAIHQPSITCKYTLKVNPIDKNLVVYFKSATYFSKGTHNTFLLNHYLF